MAEDDDPKTPKGEPASADDSGAAPPPAAPENRRARRAAAANKRRGKTPNDRIAPRPGTYGGLDASERVDDALSRGADNAVRWIKDHFNIVQWLIVAAVGTWIGLQIYTWRSDKAAAKAGLLLSEAMAAENGRIGSADDEGKRDSRGSLDVRPVFATQDERLKSAAESYRSVIAAGGAAASVAKLGLAGVLYDQGKFDDAKKAYQDVASSDLAKQDPQSKGRALEGVGLCAEAKGDEDGALQAYKALENAEVPGFHELALFDEARVMHEKGDDESAKPLLTKILQKLGKEAPEGPTDAPGYLAGSARELLMQIDPKAVPPPSSNEALQKALKEFQKKLPPGVKKVGMPALPESP